jgi:4-hydroxybenzoate polyprenyltransferase
LISPADLFSLKTAIVFFANLCLTAFGYMYNDLEDARDDYHDVDKRKRNPIASGEISQRKSYLFNFFLVTVGLYLFKLISLNVFFLGVIFAFVGFVYSWKILRLKSIPILDLISHVIFLGGLRFLTTYATFRSIDLLVVPFLLIIVPISTMNEILHELKDYKVDRDTKITNTVQRFPKSDLKKFLLALLILMAFGFIIIILMIPAEHCLINVPISLLGIFTLYRLGSRTSRISFSD